jgi:hypothetical protein
MRERAPGEPLSSAAVVVLAIVVVACFVAGMWAATTWLPPLAEGPVGTLVYFVVCGLAGAVLTIFGIRIWGIVHDLENMGTGFPGTSEIVASGLETLLWDCGSLAALTLVAYLLAPKAPEASAPSSN